MREKLYLIDFDGTITKKDTLDYLAKKLYPEFYDEWGRKIMNGEFTVKEWVEEFEKNFKFKKEDYDEILESIEIDESFIKFIENKNVIILSGGFDYNIKKILKKYEIENIKIYANQLEFIENNRIKVNMIHFNENNHSQPVCKDSILLKYRKEYNKIIYIGDGITDLTVSKLADIVYAKKGKYLEEYLKKENIEHSIFNTFDDIL